MSDQRPTGGTMTRRWAGVALLFVVCTIVVSTASAGSPGGSPEPAASEPPRDAPTLTAEEALLDDAQEFSKLHGVTKDEALRRLDLQMTAIPAFENAVAAGESAHYGGLEIQNHPTFRILVFLTSGDGADLDRYISDDRLRGLVEVHRVARTYKQLKSAQLRALRLRSVAFQSDINIPANQVELQVTSTTPSDISAKAEALRAEAARSGEPLPEWVVVKRVPALAQRALDIFGGLRLDGSAGPCTSGFSVTGPGGSGGVTTAGHCIEISNYAGNILTFKGRHFSDSYDVEWFSKSNTNFPAKIYRGQGVYGAISGKKARWNQPLGATVCKRGVTTDRTCGTITSKDFSMPPPNSGATFIVATCGVQPGDSGGPVFVGEEAWGQVVGYTGPNGVYMAANYIESSNLGLYIRGT